MSTTNPESENFNGTWTAEAITVIVCIALSIYNCVELLLLIGTTFREWRTLYCISLVVASAGILPYCVGFLLEYFQLLVYWACMTLSTVGWIALISGQSFVLYSRLGLILTDVKILKAVKWMIIIDAIVFHGATTIIQYGKFYGSRQEQFSRGLFYMEKIQMTGFTIQELIISGIYLWKTVQLLRMIEREGTRRVMYELIIINIIIILMDIALLTLEYKALRTMERACKSVIYSIKLKLEFAVLGRLVDLVQSSSRTLSSALADVDSFVDPSLSLTTTDASVPLSLAKKPENVPDWMAKLETQPRHIEHALPQEELPSNPTAKRNPFITMPRDIDNTSV